MSFLYACSLFVLEIVVTALECCISDTIVYMGSERGLKSGFGSRSQLFNALYSFFNLLLVLLSLEHAKEEAQCKSFS